MKIGTDLRKRLGILLLAGLVAFPAQAQAQAQARVLFWEVGFDTFYDTNVFLRSSQDTLFPRVGDLYTESFVTLLWGKPRGDALLVDVSGLLYRQYKELNSLAFLLGYRHPLSSRTTLWIRQGYLPRVYAGPQDHLRYATTSVLIQHRISRETRYQFHLEHRRSNHTQEAYNRETWGGGIQVTHRRGPLRLDLAYRLRDGEARGDATRDPSYLEHRGRLQARWRPTPRYSLLLGLSQTWRAYTTSNPDARLHYGRKDRYLGYRIRLAWLLRPGLEFRIGYRYRQGRTQGIDPADQAWLNYEEILYQVGLSLYR